MDSKSSGRIKFSRLCLSQTRIAGKPSESNSSQISKFFANDDQKTQTTTSQILSRSPTGANKTNSACDTESGAFHENNKRQKLESKNGDETVGVKKTSKKERRIPGPLNETKSTIKSFFSNDSNDSMLDFQIPEKVARKVSKIPSTKSTKVTRTHRKQQDIRKVLHKQNDGSQLTEEAQLELALALSKAEASGAKSDFDFKAYEFNQKNGPTTSSAEVFDLFNLNRKTIAGHKWNTKYTPLTRRKHDIQAKKILDNVNKLTVDNIVIDAELQKRSNTDGFGEDSFEICSRLLQRECIPERILFRLNGDERNVLDNFHSYYTNNLVEHSAPPAGALLKDWSKVPGRDSIYDRIGFHTDGVASEKDRTDEPDGNDVNSDVDMHSMETYVPDETQMFIGLNSIQQKSADLLGDMSAEPNEIQNDQSNSGEQSVKHSMECTESSDDDKTIVIDSDDIQSKVEEINSKIRLSQNFGDVFEKVVVNNEATKQTYTRAFSPDLFSDDDDEDNAIEICNDEKNSENIESDDLKLSTTSSVIVISSSEGESLNADLSKGIFTASADPDHIPCDSNEVKRTATNDENRSESAVIELLSDEGSNQGANSNAPSQSTSTVGGLPNFSLLLERFNKLDKELEELISSNNTSSGSQNRSKDVSASAGTQPTKVLSFTEKLEIYDNDVINGFNLDVPTFEPEASQNLSQLSQESAISDNEVNYSINVESNRNYYTECKSPAMHDGLDEMNSFGYSDPIEFNLRENGFDLNVDDNLVNKSVCNILEKTFDHGSSPVSKSKAKSSAGIGTFKKTYSESVLSSRFGPPDSSSRCNPNLNRIGEFRTPTKSTVSSSSKSPAIDLSNDDYIIRIGSVSPKPNYEQMDKAELEMELRKFGLKPSMSRRHAIICLDYIYIRTHPFLANVVEQQSPKTQSTQHDDLKTKPQKDSAINFNVGFSTHNLADERFKTSNQDRIILPSRPRAKKSWCLQPLHIAWHNLIKANAEVFNSVLTYTPINLHELKQFFKSIDMIFENRDLIAFLDMKSITFRTNKAASDK